MSITDHIPRLCHMQSKGSVMLGLVAAKVDDLVHYAFVYAVILKFLLHSWFAAKQEL